MELVNIGTITGTHHLNGAVKVTSIFQDTDVIISEKVLLEKNNDKKLCTVKSVKRINNKKLIVEFSEINNINDAKSLNGYQVKIRRDLLPEKTEEDFYYNDLLGMKVFEKEEYLGDILDTMETAAHDILVVVNSDGREILVPMVDIFVKKIDFEAGKIEVELIEGMKE